MKEWQVKQEVYHRLNKDHTDDLNKVEIVFDDNQEVIIKNAILHFNEKVDEWLYPAKSYVVAICYAYWISRDFDEDFYDLLNDPMLLAENDPYFKTYENSKEIYDRILNNIDWPLMVIHGMVRDIKGYYDVEIGY
tara:strand:- start:49033 stop:49437 length:405 start_codon:yes stop_codon:yes gene_type:complete